MQTLRSDYQVHDSSQVIVHGGSIRDRLGGGSPESINAFFIMGKSKKGGVYGFLRGRVGSVSYSILPAKSSTSGKKEQVVRALPDSVANPQTVSQVMQRMKLKPATAFFNAFRELLSNAFQGVEYGDKSRRFFISEAMKMTGPYIQKGVDRFIPAEYPFSRGTLPSVGIVPFDGGATKITLNAIAAEATITPEILAAALGVATDTQITVAVVNNNAGVFTPAYIGFDERLKIADLPAAALGKDTTSNQIQLDIAALGLEASAVVAMAVVLSRQDASGTWLRSEQNLVISNQLRQTLYSPEALQAAIASYQDESAVNTINSQWYYNLGLNQAFNGQVTFMSLAFTGGSADILVGIQNIGGQIRYTAFATENDEIIGVRGQSATIAMLSENESVTVSDMEERYPNISIEPYTSAIAIQGGYDDEVSSEETIVGYMREAPNEAGAKVMVNSEGKVILGVIDGDTTPSHRLITTLISGDYACKDFNDSDLQDTDALIEAWGFVETTGVVDGTTRVIGDVYTIDNNTGDITPTPEDFQ